MSKKSINYKEALARIDEIVALIESENLDIDELTKMVKEATQLIAACKDKLHNTKNDLQSSLDKLN
ncbi:exodeoxyribonuclease VII small subunit [Roseivirga misakiensis]|uniref:Exodeoxyribonuclease VII small subunit n=1 Tax=Roseivirga misakiensis TaxID=1563681 RepID=A0A1E5T1K3_9BACT|nr:exodeoxyribonuclease VII small subunit [Roseivirga misakiensis]OEK05250.1 exodeoxyribonuclease VII small subunit [Roseivirga misakiensis]